MSPDLKKSYFEKRINRTFPDIIKHQGFMLHFGKVGYQNYGFGTRIRFTDRDSVRVLFHEIAHAIEFGAANFDERVDEFGDFVFNLPYFYAFGQTFTDLQTSQPTERELRTWAIQLVLYRHAGIKADPKKLVRSWVDNIQFMPDYCLLENGKVRRAAKRIYKRKGLVFHSASEKYKQDEKFLVEYYARKVERMAANVCIDDCRAELQKWCDMTWARLQSMQEQSIQE